MREVFASICTRKWYSYIMRKLAEVDEKIRKNLLAVMENRNLTQRAVAQMAGMKPQVLNAYLQKKRGFGQVTIEKLARALDVSQGYLIGGKTNAADAFKERLDRSVFGTRTPVVTYEKAGEWDEYTDVGREGYAIAWLPFKVRDQNDIAVRMQDDSMEPEFTKGQIIILGRPSKNLNGKYVLARIGKDVFFRRYRTFEHGVVLTALNPLYRETVIINKESDRLHIAAVAIAQVRLYR